MPSSPDLAMATASTVHRPNTYLTSHSHHNDENRPVSENTTISSNAIFPDHSISAIRASSLEDSHIDHLRLAEQTIGPQFTSSPPIDQSQCAWRNSSGQLPPHSQWPQSPSSSTFSMMEGHMSNHEFSQLEYAHPSVTCSLQQYRLESQMDQLRSQFYTQRDQPPCVYSSLQSNPCLLPESITQQDFETYLSQFQLPPSSSSATGIVGCHVSEADCPKPDHRAAHVLTVLRSSQGSSPPCFSGGMAAICQQQICTKEDCPPDTQLRCPSEDIEAQQCPGDCAGRVCNGTGCPCNTSCEVARTTYDYPKALNNDMWPCGWPSNTMVCNAPVPRCPTAKPFEFNGNMASLHSQNHSPACNGVLVQKQASERNILLEHHITNDFGCSLNQCCDFWEVCEGDPCTYSDLCHDQIQWEQCLWDDCSLMPTNMEKGERHPDLESSHHGMVSGQPPTKSASAVPSMASEDSGRAKQMANICLWVMDQSSGLLCGFSCDHGNDLQTHIERAHIDPQVAKSESGQKRASLRVPKSLVCKWEGCKHHEQKKTFRQTQALKQHVITHSRYKSAQCPECGQMCVDKTNLEIHMRTHTGEKPYKCKYCDDRFAARSTLITHERTHTGEKVFKCEVCQYSCGDSSNFTRHKRKHEAPAFHCGICNKDFHRREHLTRHMKSIHEKGAKGASNTGTQSTPQIGLPTIQG